MNSDVAKPVIDYLDLVKTASAVFSPFVGAILGYWFRGWELRKSERVERTNEICKELEVLCSVACQYWCRDTISSPNPDIDIAQEAEIQGRVHSINVLTEDVIEGLNSKTASQIRLSVIDLRQAITGADFASVRGHGRSATAISRTFVTTASLRTLLRRGFRR